MTMKLMVFILLYALFSLSSYAQTLPIDYETARLERVANAVRISEEINLDGNLNDPAWKLARPATDFIAQSPRPGEPAQEKTEVFFLYDDSNLYVGIYAYHSDLDDIVVNELTEDFNF